MSNLSCTSRAPLLTAVLLALAGVACSSSTTATFDGGTGGPVTGALDMHCSGVTPIVLDPASCHVGGDAGAPDPDAGAPEENPILFNAEADDDDCKYHVKYTVTPAPHVNEKVTFKITVTKLADNQPATGAIDSFGNGISIEGFLEDNDTHVLPNQTPPTKATETPAGSGIYTVTPVQLDSSGRWIVKFHFFETCLDQLEDSQHGHVSFFFDMP